MQLLLQAFAARSGRLLGGPRRLLSSAIGGPLHGPEHLLSSNVDWGQDLRYMKWDLANSRASVIGYCMFDVEKLGFKSAVDHLVKSDGAFQNRFLIVSAVLYHSPVHAWDPSVADFLANFVQDTATTHTVHHYLYSMYRIELNAQRSNISSN